MYTTIRFIEKASERPLSLNIATKIRVNLVYMLKKLLNHSSFASASFDAAGGDGPVYKSSWPESAYSAGPFSVSFYDVTGF